MPDTPPPRPRWVRFAGAAVALVVIALVIGKIAGVEHGPGTHGGDGGTATQQSESGGEHRPPDGVPTHTMPQR